jgi:outer membrane receptor protein involved in Fe transport
MDTDSAGTDQGTSPVNSAQLRSHYALPHGFEWNASAYFVGGIADPSVPSYTRLDTSLTWQWKERGSITLAGQNLLTDHRLEYIDRDGITSSTLAKRGVYAEFMWHF